jgi:hypothetical protein
MCRWKSWPLGLAMLLSNIDGIPALVDLSWSDLASSLLKGHSYFLDVCGL